MKKVFSIGLLLLFILSGMHISLARHYCAGEISALKWSFSEQKASCGMEETATDLCHFPQLTTSSCCKDEISVYAIDNKFFPSENQLINPAKTIIQDLYLPEFLFPLSCKPTILVHTNVSPPGKILASLVDLTDICVFRI